MKKKHRHRYKPGLCSSVCWIFNYSCDHKKCKCGKRKPEKKAKEAG